MKLQRKFDWLDRESIYKVVIEDDVEKGIGGLVRFIAVRLDGTKFSGQGYESTVACMVDAESGFWKLKPNPRNAEKSIIVAANPSFNESETGTEKALELGIHPTRKRKGD